MADIEWLIEQIETGPEGPHIGAFFDFDGTLIDGYSAAAFFKARLRKGDIGLRELVATVQESVNVERRGATTSPNSCGSASRHSPAARPTNSTGGPARSSPKKIAGKLFPDSRVLIDAHKRMGHTVVVASSATLPQIEPTADDLGIHHIVCTDVEVDEDGMLTGRLSSDIRWGEGKAAGGATSPRRTRSNCLSRSRTATVPRTCPSSNWSAIRVP